MCKEEVVNFTYTLFNDMIIIHLSGIGDYGDDERVKKLINSLVKENISKIVLDFKNIDTINSAAVAAIIYLLKYTDERLIDIIFVGANDKVVLILERAMPKYLVNVITEDEFYKLYNIKI